MKIAQRFSNIKEQLQIIPEIDKKILISDLIHELLRKLIDEEKEFSSEDTFFSFGVDSMLLIQFKLLLEKHLGNSIPTDIFYKYDTTESLSSYICKEKL